MTNTIEYNDLKFGSRDEGFIFSVRPFMAKMGSSGVKLIETVVLLAVGYTAISKIISEAVVDQANGVITQEVMNAKIAEALSSADPNAAQWIMVCMAVLPVLFLIGAFVLYMKKYKIDEKEYEEICAKIRERDGITEESTCECGCGCDCCCHDGEECDCECGCDCCSEDNDAEEKCTCGCCAEHTPDVE